MNEYTLELKKILKQAEREKNELQSEYIEIEHFILSILLTENNIKNILNSYGINYEKYKIELLKEKTKKELNDSNIYSIEFKRIIDNASIYNRDKNNIITINSLFLSALEDEDNLGIILLEKLGCNLNELYIKIKKSIINDENLYINEIGINLNELVKENKYEKVIGREKELKRIIEIIARKNKNNPILLGEAGVGKTAIVEELARRINTGNVPDILKNKKIIILSMASLVAGTRYRGEFEEKLTKILKELENREDIILFIDEVHTLVGAGGAEGAIDASNILKPALARNSIKLIGATTIKEYKKFIESDKALDRRFQKIYVYEPDENETYDILKKIKNDYEKYHNVKIKDDILKLIPSLSKKYLPYLKEPDRSIDVLDEVCAKTNVLTINKKYLKLISDKESLNNKKKEAILKENYLEAAKIRKKELELDNLLQKENKNKIIKEVTEDNLKQVLEQKSSSIILELSNKEKIKEELKNKLNKKIVNQKENINNIVNLIINGNKKPISFLFIGKSGVGKTYTSTLLSKYLKYNLIKLDMSDYSSDMSINRILGTTQGYIGYNDKNTVFEKVKEKPNSIILIENIKKANKKIKNILLNIIEEGTITLLSGEVIDLHNCIFIFTSNITTNNKVGFNQIRNNILTKNDLEEKVMEIIKFNDLNKNDIKKIIYKNIKEIDSNLIDEIITESDYQKCGAKKVMKKLYKNYNLMYK